MSTFAASTLEMLEVRKVTNNEDMLTEQARPYASMISNGSEPGPQ